MFMKNFDRLIDYQTSSLGSIGHVDVKIKKSKQIVKRINIMRYTHVFCISILW